MAGERYNRLKDLTSRTHHKPMSFITKVCQIPKTAVEPRWGMRVVEPSLDVGHAIRGNVYLLLELVSPLENGEETAPAEDETVTKVREPGQSPQSAPAALSASEIAQLSERLLGLAQTTYYTAKGAQAVVAQRAVMEVHEALRVFNHQNPQYHLRAGLTCVALLRQRLVVVASGPSLALIATDEALEQFPWHQSAPNMTLGADRAPEIHVHKRKLQGSAAIFIGVVQWLERVAVRKLLGIVAQSTVEECEEIAQYIEQQNQGAALPGLLISVDGLGYNGHTSPSPTADTSQSEEPTSPRHDAGPPDGQTPFVPPSQQIGPQNEAAEPRFQGGSTAVPPPNAPIANPILRKRSSGLPTSVGANPPVVRAPSEDNVESIDFERFESMHPQVESIFHEVAPDQTSAPGHAQEQPSTAVNDSGQSQNRQSGLGLPPGFEEDSNSLFRYESLREQLDKVKQLVVGMLPERIRDENVISRAGSRQLRPRRVNTASDPVAATAATVEQQRAENAPIRESVQYTPPPPASGSRARVILSLAILIAFVVVAVVYGVTWWQGNARVAEATELVNAAEGHINNARVALDEGNKGTARTSLQNAQVYLIEAAQLVGETNEIDTLQKTISKELQGILNVTPLYGLVEPLITFPASMSPHRVLVVDQDIYILDTGLHQIVRYRLDESQTDVPDEEGSIVLKQGQSVEGAVVGQLLDIAWQAPIAGVEDKANLLVLDSNNRIFRYNQRVDGAALQTFGDQQSWVAPTQIQTYLGRFYMADGGRGQIYRYSPGAYDQQPEPWLLAANPAAVASLSSMMIDGDIWLLFDAGLLLRYNQGEQLPFEREDDVGVIREPVDLYVGTQENSLVYIADAGEQRILVYSKEGAYIQQYQAPEGEPLKNLRGIYVDEIAESIFILTLHGLFLHPLPQ